MVSRCRCGSVVPDSGLKSKYLLGRETQIWVRRKMKENRQKMVKKPQNMLSMSSYDKNNSKLCLEQVSERFGFF